MEPESLEWELGLRRRLVAGHRDAFADLYDQYAAVVFGVAMRVTSNRQAAEDVSQAVFLEAWEHADRFDPTRGSWRSWLATIDNALVSWLRMVVFPGEPEFVRG